MNESGPTVRLELKTSPDSIELGYSIKNTSLQPIFVFDRLWDKEKQAIDPRWAYIEIEGERAVVKRQMEELPFGLRFEDPPVPYAREVAPGGEAAGIIRAPLPLPERGPYDHIVKRGTTPVEVTISSLTLHIGWSPKPATLPPGVSPVELEGERLLLLPYNLVKDIQQVASSPSEPVTIRGIDAR